MEKSAPPSSPRRQASVRASFQRRGSHVEGREDLETAGDTSINDPSSREDGSTPGDHGSALHDASPRIDRSVRTRTQDRITLQLTGMEDAAATGGDPLLRGWRSPHGEPYRPLGNPNLGLKFTPRLHGDPAKQPLSSVSAKDDAGGRREPSTTSREKAVRPSPPPPGSVQVLDMFPRNIRKRPPEDRQVRLALRLQESIAQYSPEKTRGLQRAKAVHITRVAGDTGDDSETSRDDDNEDVHGVLLRLQEQHRQSARGGSEARSPSASPRYHVQHGDTSFLMLRGAVQQGAARLQLVRNGQNFVGAIPTSETLDLVELKRHYEVAREKYLAELDTRRKLGNVIHLGSTKTSQATADDDDDSDDDANPNHHHAHSHSISQHNTPLYLPYTTREPHQSPHKPLPTLAEFKAKAREERMPIRALVSSRASMATTAPASDTTGGPRSPTSPRVAPGTGGAVSPGRRAVQSIAALTPSQPPKLSRAQSRRGSVVLTTRSSVVGLGAGDTGGTLGMVDLGNDALARAVASVAAAADPAPLPRVHSVVRLQGAIDSVEAVKDAQAHMLAKTLAALDQDRRDCLETKYRNLAIDTQLDVDMERMRSNAEIDRTDHAASNLASYTWYAELLRQLITSRESNYTLQPAELFCIDVIRRVASEGHAFQREQLYRLVLLLHPDDVAVAEVQQILTFLKRALVISPAEWTSFFLAHRLPEPVEIFKPSEDSKLKEKKKQMRMSKFRSVVRISQVLRRLTTPVTQQ